MSVTIGFMFGLIEDQVNTFYLEKCKLHHRVFNLSNFNGTNI